MPSPNLAIAHVAASQNQKEVTINDAIDALDRAMNDTLALDLSAGPRRPILGAAAHCPRQSRGSNGPSPAVKASSPASQ
jgi:hypothetical protein